MSRTLTRRRVVSTGVLSMVLAATAACGGGSSSGTQSVKPAAGGTSASTSSTSASVDPAIAAMVPAAIKNKGTLVVAEDASYAPNEFKKPGSTKVVGMDADLANALVTTMGLKTDIKDIVFGSIIPGMRAGRYDLGMSSFTDTKAREKVVDFVTYFSAGTAFFVNASSGPTINTLADLCGHKVAVESGTTQESDANAQRAKCTAAGKSPDSVQSYTDQNGANLALSTGRADVSMADSPVAAYQVQQSHGKFKLTGQIYGTAPYGIAIPKNNGMAPVVLAAVKHLMSTGVYQAILAKWNISSGAITNPVINGAIS